TSGARANRLGSQAPRWDGLATRELPSSAAAVQEGKTPLPAGFTAILGAGGPHRASAVRTSPQCAVNQIARAVSEAAGGRFPTGSGGGCPGELSWIRADPSSDIRRLPCGCRRRLELRKHR